MNGGPAREIRFDGNQVPVELRLLCWSVSVLQFQSGRRVRLLPPLEGGQPGAAPGTLTIIEKGLYLDPKNPTALKLDQNKMDEVSKIIPILYGDLNTIKRELI